MTYIPSPANKVKPADETRTNTSVYAADTDLVLPLPAGNWYVRGRIYAVFTIGSGIKLKLVPTNMDLAPYWRYRISAVIGTQSLDDPNAFTKEAYMLRDDGYHAIEWLTGSGSDTDNNFLAIEIVGDSVIAAASANLTISWACNPGVAAHNATIKRGSYLEAVKIS